LIDELRARMTAFLAVYRVGVLSTASAEGAWAMPVHYRLVPDDDLAVECLLPAWADVSYFLERDPRALFIIQIPSAGEGGDGLRWLQILGTASIIARPAWDSFLPAPPLEGQYRVIRLAPRRIDLFDEGRGWGARETLDL
jgi:hypothetical protein